MSPELQALGLSLEVLALRVERGEAVPTSTLEAAAESVERAGPGLSEDGRRWLHERVQRMLQAMETAQQQRRGRLAHLQRGRKAVRGYAVQP